MSDPFVGEVRIFANTYVPDGWVPCDGRVLPILSYQALNAVIGNLYTSNPSSTTFNVPNLNGRIAIAPGVASGGAGTTSYIIGHTDGVDSVGLDVNHIPSHTHQLQKKNTNVAGPSGKTAVPNIVSDLGGLSTTDSVSYSALIPGGTPNTTLHPSTLGAFGGAVAHENRQPYLGLYFAIAYTGLFPVQP
jgi:microcystin-dependent protein